MTLCLLSDLLIISSFGFILSTTPSHFNMLALRTERKTCAKLLIYHCSISNYTATKVESCLDLPVFQDGSKKDQLDRFRRMGSYKERL